MMIRMIEIYLLNYEDLDICIIIGNPNVFIN